MSMDSVYKYEEGPQLVEMNQVTWQASFERTKIGHGYYHPFFETVSLKLFTGEIDSKLYVAHRCCHCYMCSLPWCSPLSLLFVRDSVITYF